MSHLIYPSARACGYLPLSFYVEGLLSAISRCRFPCACACVLCGVSLYVLNTKSGRGCVRRVVCVSDQAHDATN